ncbi:hypothetical protein HDE_09529 [Halotydeus destructor]|nr:hypothetical protein HDE_09529 [Halotydeus destructor]
MSYHASVWFFVLFLNCLTLSTTLTRRTVVWDEVSIGHVITTVVDLLMVASVIFHVDFADRRAENLHATLVDKMNGSESPEMRALVKEMGSSYKLDVSVWSMFKIDRGAILTFTSAVVSFTVLFAQMAP